MSLLPEAVSDVIPTLDVARHFIVRSGCSVGLDVIYDIRREKQGKTTHTLISDLAQGVTKDSRPHRPLHLVVVKVKFLCK